MRYQGTNSDGIELTSAYVELDRDNPAICLDCSDLPSLTRQEFADDCDINNLMAKYEKTGVINHFNSGTPQFVDYSALPDLQNSLTVLADARAAFMQLPAHIRRDFDNDPVEFVNFASDKTNLNQLREWGLAPPLPSEPAPMKVEVINPDSKSDA
jgi:phage internal scaffolding protein